MAFASLGADSALQIVLNWLAAWQQGLNAPLPVSLHTAMNYLKHHSDHKAQEVYEGSFQIRAEVQKSAALARQYATYAALIADTTFEHWAEQLYGALFNAEIISVPRQGESV